MTTAAHRIRELRREWKVSQAGLGDFAGGLTKQAVYEWEKGDSTPGVDALLALQRRKGINPEWILHGTGPKFTSGGRTPISAWDDPEHLPADQYVLIPRRRVALSAGNGHLLFEDEEAPPIPLSTTLVRRLGLRAADAVLVYAEGDSMEPGICDGDLLLVDLAARDVREGAIYALRYADQLRVKRLFRRYDGGLILRSDNAARYPDEAIPPEHQDGHVAIIGRVIWRGGAL